MLVEKEVISPGTYWYLDQKTGVPRRWDVTADTTKYLHEQGNKMLACGLPIPIPCEHDFQAHPMTPAEQLKQNAGEVKEFRLRDSTLFSVCDIQDEEIARKIPKSIRWTSPWINSFVDGSGRAWNNVVAHLALTTRPRITKQAPFPSVGAAMAFALNAEELKLDLTKKGEDNGFTVSKALRLIKDGKKFRPEFPMAFSLCGGIALGDGDFPGDNDSAPPPKKKKPSDSSNPPEGGKKKAKVEGEEEGKPPEGTTPGDNDNDMPEEKGGHSDDKMSEFGDKVGDVAMEEVLADLLGALGIHLEGTVGEAQFKRALYNAAMTKIHELTGKAQSEPGMGDTTNQPPNGQGNNTPPNPLVHQEQQPMYMSLEDINKIEEPTMKSIALSMYNENVKLRGELETNAKATASLRDAKLKEENARRNTRVSLLSKALPKTKADLDAMLALPSMALSMGDGGVVIDPMAQTLAILEKGLQDIPRLLTTDSAAFAQPQPTDADVMSQERENELADNMARMMGAAPELKK